MRWFDITLVAFDKDDVCVLEGETLDSAFQGPCYATLEFRVYVAALKNCYDTIVRSVSTSDPNTPMSVSFDYPLIDSDLTSSNVTSNMTETTLVIGKYPLVFRATSTHAGAPVICKTLV